MFFFPKITWDIVGSPPNFLKEERIPRYEISLRFSSAIIPFILPELPSAIFFEILPGIPSEILAVIPVRTSSWFYKDPLKTQAGISSRISSPIPPERRIPAEILPHILSWILFMIPSRISPGIHAEIPSLTFFNFQHKAGLSRGDCFSNYSEGSSHYYLRYFSGIFF